MTRPSLFFRLRAATRTGFQDHGIAFPWVVVHRSGVYFWRKNFGARTFSLSGQSHAYVIHPFVLDNERVVEVALARDFLAGRSGAILEVGNVLGNFLNRPHDVVDKYEKAPGVVNEDVITYQPAKKYAAIVTLSTLEHVGWDETPRTPEKILQAIEHLKQLLAGGGELLATMPLGYNSYLDQILREKRTGFAEVKFLIRTTADNQWREASLEEALAKPFGKPYACANALMVGTFQSPPRPV
jgi:hypothetical protein